MNTSQNLKESWKQFIEEQVNDHIIYFFNHMPDVDDEIVTFLKGHLLIEKKLRELLEIETENPKSLNDVRLSFHQLLSIVEALHWFKNFEWVWEGSRRINKIRNNIAHQLISEKLKSEILGFRKYVEKRYPNGWKKEMPIKSENRLLIAIAITYANLSAYLRNWKYKTNRK